MNRREFLHFGAGALISGAELVNNPHRLFIPQAEHSPAEVRNWNTFSSDLSAIKARTGIHIDPQNIHVENMNGFDGATRELFRRLQLKTAERTEQAIKTVAKEGQYTESEIKNIFLQPISKLEFSHDPNRGDGASTYISIQNNGYSVATGFGTELPHFLTNIGNEAIHQEIAGKAVHEKYPEYGTTILEALSFLNEWDLIRSSRIGSPDTYVELSLNSLQESLRSLRTDYYIPYERTIDYEAIVRSITSLSSFSGRDSALIRLKESVASRIASEIIHSDYGLLKEHILRYLAGVSTGKNVSNSIATAISKILPSQEGTMIPERVTQLFALDHSIQPTERPGLHQEPGFLVHGITFFRDGTNISVVHTGDIVSATTNAGITVDHTKLYEVGIENTSHYGIYMPLSAFSNPTVPDGTTITLTMNVGGQTKTHNLTWNFQGSAPENITQSSGDPDQSIFGKYEYVTSSQQ